MTQTSMTRYGEEREETAVPYSLLVVDDDEAIVSLLCAMLAQENRYRILTATGPSRALELLRVEPFDLLITDYRMPDMTGLDLIREARRRHPDLIGILITGFAWPDAAVEAAEAGAYDLLLKPLNIGEVRVRVRNACERLSLVREIRRYQYALKQARQDRIPRVHRVGSVESIAEIGLFPPAPPSVTRGPQQKEQMIDQLERLAKLYQTGLLTTEEFALIRNKLFNRI